MNEDLRLRHQLLKFGTARAGRAPAPPPLDAVLPPVDADQAEAALRLSLGARPVGTQRFPGARQSRSAGAARAAAPLPTTCGSRAGPAAAWPASAALQAEWLNQTCTWSRPCSA